MVTRKAKEQGTRVLADPGDGDRGGGEKCETAENEDGGGPVGVQKLLENGCWGHGNGPC
jgi:alpha-mannosidase